MTTTATPPPVPLPTYYTLGAGAVAGIFELACLYPLDVVKTRLQLQRQARSDAPRGIARMLVSIVRHEGLATLYRGIAPLLVLEAPKRALKFGANDAWGKAMRPVVRHQRVRAVVTGCLAGATESLMVVPFELVKVRLQDRAQRSLYRGPMDVVRHIVRQDGYAGLYRGLPATMIRHVMWNGGYFGSIPAIQARLPRATSTSERLRNSLVSGTLGGFIGTVLNTPLDVVKTRIQNASTYSGGTFTQLGHILRHEGAGALYKGFWPKVVRLAPGGGLMLLVVDAITSYVRVWLGPPYYT